MGMYENFLDIITYLKSDEELNRLLYYLPEDLGSGVFDPLNPGLPNIMDKVITERSGIINQRIVKSSKYTDLQKLEICRIYVYAGRRSPERNNYLMAEQQVVIDILCHSKFENGDLRSLRISDRLNKLFCQERVTGIGKMEFVNGGQINAPYEYTGYQVIFQFGNFNK